MKKKFVAQACRWFDKVNGNTYHSVRITRCSDGAVIACPWGYGYGEQYRDTALLAMSKAGWIPAKYREAGDPAETSTLYRYERENNYPVLWSVSDGLKRDMVKNGQTERGDA